MTKIRIQAKGLDSSISATIGPGTALLIGRAPDPKRLDWSQLRPPPSACDPMKPSIKPERYHLTTLPIPSPRASANHLLALKDGSTLALFELGSRNGSWIKLEPQHPVMVAGALEVALSLAGQPVTDLLPHRPANAEWTDTTDFGAAVVTALTTWSAQQDAPVQFQLDVVGSAAGRTANILPLADGQAILLRVNGTMPCSIDELQQIASQYVHDQNARYMQLERRVPGMVASSLAIREILYRLADAAASSRRTILLGPTGVGKELLARSYHGYSPRHNGPFVTVNCALLDKDLLHAQLFGARRGSFTGAVNDVVGLLESAHGGTLFLDELGEMSSDVQKALLRFLDSRGEYYRLGDARLRTADVQIVCASNRDLDDPACRSQYFRSDLWYRLASSVLRIPPLRERPEDIRAFLSSRSVPGSALRIVDCLSPEALTAVLRDPWPGNFRDLENFLDRLPPAARPQSIDLATCKRALREGRDSSASPAPQSCPSLTPAAVVLSEPSTLAAGPTPCLMVATARRRASVVSPSVTPAVSASTLASCLPPAAPVTSRELPRPAGLRGSTHVDSNAALGWETITQHAVRAFLEDHGEARVGWDQLQTLIERYLKPLFVAQAAASRPPASEGRATNYSALARRLHIGDGSTVKNHLARFEERFAAMSCAACRASTESSGSVP